MTSPPVHAPEPHNRPQTVAIVTIAGLGVLGALYIGRAFFAPIALALFLNTLLRPAVRRLERYRIPAPFGATLVMLGLVGLAVAGGALLERPAQDWIAHAPESFKSAQTRVRSMWKPFQKVTTAASDLGRTAISPNETSKTVTVTAAPPAVGAGLFGSTASAIAGAAEVILLLFLLLAGGGMFLERLMGIIPARADKRTAAQIASEVETAVAHYLVTSALINVGEGIVVGLSLWALGMPDPALWALLTIGLEFIPYVGAAALIVALSVSALATFDALGHAALVPLSYLVISVVQNNVVSPLLYGNRLKLNAVAVLIAVLFWGSLWGVVGAFLAVPILAAVKIVCDHVESLQSVGKFLRA
jgi:predicted PurR-regulated permease PerM